MKQKDKNLVQNVIAIMSSDIGWSSFKSKFSLIHKE